MVVVKKSIFIRAPMAKVDALALDPESRIIWFPGMGELEEQTGDGGVGTVTLPLHTEAQIGDSAPGYLDGTFVPLRPGLVLSNRKRVPLTQEVIDLFKIDQGWCFPFLRLAPTDRQAAAFRPARDLMKGQLRYERDSVSGENRSRKYGQHGDER